MELYRNEHILKNGQKLIIRVPEVGDAEGLIDLIRTVDTETKFLAREPDEFNVTLEEEGKIIANCQVGLVNNKKRYLHRAYLAVVVRKDFWNQGIGGKMMQECIKWCQEKGVEQLELEVVTKNKHAISMYESFGFEIYAKKKHALKYNDGTYADEHCMCLFLTEHNKTIV